MEHTDTILVLGATGHVGRHVVAGLLETGARVRAAVRRPDAAHLPAGVEVVHGDLTQPESLERAASGAASIFLLWPTPDTSAATDALVALTRDTSHIVYLSALDGPENHRPDGFWGDIEDLIRASGVHWTFIRAGGFATNVLGWADQIRTGVVRWPYGDAGRSLIHEQDIADVAVEALMAGGHTGRSYPLTGPEVLTQIEQVRIIGEELGREVQWEEQPVEEARERLVASWGDPDFVEMALAAWAAMVDAPEQVVGGPESITGNPARTFRQWVRDHLHYFR